MLFKRFESKGLAHYSYLIGDGNQALVIDPQRDGDAYVQAASQEGTRITHILETHRNEGSFTEWSSYPDNPVVTGDSPR